MSIENGGRIHVQPVTKHTRIDLTEIEARLQAAIAHAAEIRRLSDQPRLHLSADQEQHAGVAMVWDIVLILASIGGAVLSFTTLWQRRRLDEELIEA